MEFVVPVVDVVHAPSLVAELNRLAGQLVELVVGEEQAGTLGDLRLQAAPQLADNVEDDNPGGERARRAAGARIQQTKKAEFHSLDLVLGPSLAEAVPGARLPYTWLGAGRSLYDELGPGLTLMILADSEGRDAIERAARRAGRLVRRPAAR
jgi:hypothetical protein